jgi:hypothetical protein
MRRTGAKTWQPVRISNSQREEDIKITIDQVPPLFGVLERRTRMKIRKEVE